MKSTRTFRLALALALLFNVAGSPMAWAQWLEGAAPAAVSGAMTDLADASMAGSTMDMDCHGHATTFTDDTAPSVPSCCDGSGCDCAAPALFVIGGAAAVQAAHSPLAVAPATTPARARPLDDALRPPIY